MTKFMKNINTVNTQERKAIIRNLTFNMDSKVDHSLYSHNEAVKTEFRAEYYSYAWVPENNGNMISQSRKDILEGFRREVYGDVEDHVIQIMESVYQGQDEQETLNHCRNLMALLKEI